MAYSFRRAYKAIAVTSSTTSVAFGSNIFSPIVPIRAFGFQSALIVLVNYFMVVMIMPSVQITYECYFMEKCNFCSRIKKSLSPKLTAFKNRIRSMGRGEKANDQGETGATSEHQGKEGKGEAKSEKRIVEPDFDTSTERHLQSKREEDRAAPEKAAPAKDQNHLVDDKTDCLTRFFAGPFNTFIFRFRYVLIGLLIALGIASAAVASQMGPLSKGEELMSKEHPLIETQRVMLQEFDTGLGSPSTLSVSITWGVKGVDRSDIGRWDASDMGVLEWDREFTVAPAANQIALLQFCDYLVNES